MKRELKTALVLLVWFVVANFIIDIMVIAPDWVQLVIAAGLLFSFVPLYAVVMET